LLTNPEKSVTKVLENLTKAYKCLKKATGLSPMETDNIA